MAFQAAELSLDGTKHTLPLVTGTDGNQALDISDLHRKTGLATYDPNLRNTALTKSSITWIDPKNGRLLYRGYDVEDLVENSAFVETAYLLSTGKLPNAAEYKRYSTMLSKHSMIHESMRNFFDAFPGDAHPLAILSVMVTSLSSYYPATYEENIQAGVDLKARLLAKVRTLAAWAYKKSAGQPVIYPRDNLPYCINYLNMMFAVPSETYSVPEKHDKIMNKLLILYSDHEQNVATSTVRLVGSTRGNIFACISAGMCALWGQRESAANLPPMRMLNEMLDNHKTPEQYFEKFIKGQETAHFNALGHPSYDAMDPRAVIAKKIFNEYLSEHPHFREDRHIKLALEVEEFVTGHPHFLELNLYPSLDFYAGLCFHMIGIPFRMHNVTRVIGKLAGWLAHWEEQHATRSSGRSYRPRQVYGGELTNKWIPVDRRD